MKRFIVIEKSIGDYLIVDREDFAKEFKERLTWDKEHKYIVICVESPEPIKITEL